jgi:disulfide bond formation protein DsbB
MPETTSSTSPAGWNGLFGAWFMATAATLGSLFFSEVMELPPCSLCWYQRIFMFPLPLVLLVGLVPFDPRAVRYGLALCAVGGAIATWHTLLYVGILPESAAPCVQGVPCTQPTFELFGVLSIPALSLLAFTAIASLLLWSWRASRRSS